MTYKKIILTYKSKVKNVFTQEVLIATDENDLTYKLTLLYNRWFNLLCSHINFDLYLMEIKNLTLNYNITMNEINEMKQHLIERHLEDLNNNYNRGELLSFQIEVVDIEF